MTLRYVDLFAGMGGFRLAADASELDLQPVAWSELERRAAAVYRAAHDAQDEVFVPDVRSVRTGRGAAIKGEQALPDFDVLFAGFPCQTFSNVGRRQGWADERGRLTYQILRILKHYQPRFFVLENVQKIATIGRGALLKELVGDLAGVGYDVNLYDLVASDYGLPQQRRRLFFCGARRDIAKDIGQAPPPVVPREQWRYPTSWHLLAHEMPAEHLIPIKTRETVLRPNPKWMGDLQIDRATARPVCASMAKWHRANQDNYFSATYTSPDNPDPWTSPDVDLQTEPIRRITPLEGFRLQGFPDRFAGIVREQRLAFTPTYRLIGNAVPVHVATSVLDFFIGRQVA